MFLLGVTVGDLAAIGGLELFDRLTDIRSPAVVFIMDCYMCLAFSVLVFVLFCRFTRKNRFILEGMLPKNDRRFLSRFGVGVLLGFLSNFFCILCALLNGDIKLVWDFSTSGIPVMLLAFIAVFFQSVNEEVWCRGFMYERISIHYPLWVAILANSVVFGLLHIFNDGVTALAIVIGMTTSISEATCSTSTANGVAACGKLLPLRVAIKEFARIGIEQVRTHSQACQMSSHLGTGCRHLQRNDVETCGLRA